MKYIGKILPIEGYYVSLKGNLPVDYAISLTHLYQPLIGIESIMLYQTLLHDKNLQINQSLQTHHTLMNYLNLPLNQLYEARLKLEGIGLVQTFIHNEEPRWYTYELQIPFSPYSFFQDAMLSELLYHHIGEQKYEQLRRLFTSKYEEVRGENITATFQEVFQTFHPSFEHGSSRDIPDLNERRTSKQIDFSWIEQMLKQRMIPVHQVLTEENKLLISQMKALYDLDPYEIDKSILWAVTEDHMLDREEFKSACHDLFKVKYNDVSIKLVQHRSSETIEQNKDVPQSKEQQLVQALQKMTPKELLEDLSNGNHASEQDMKIIREVMTKQGLPPAVMNVLIHYILLQSNMKLSKSYMEKIASHWSRAKLKTAQDAMEFAKKETQKRTKSATDKRSGYKQTRTSGAVIPDWFKERKQKQKQMPKQSPMKQDLDIEKEKEEVLALLRKHSSTKQNNHLQG